MTDIFHENKAKGNSNAGYNRDATTGNEQRNPNIPRDMDSEFYKETTRTSNRDGAVDQIQTEYSRTKGGEVDLTQTEYSHTRGGTGRNVSIGNSEQTASNSGMYEGYDSHDQSGGGGFLNQAISAITGQSGKSGVAQSGTGRGSQAETPGSWKTGDTSTKSFISEKGVIDENPRAGNSMSDPKVNANLHVPGTRGSQPAGSNNQKSDFQSKGSAAESGVGTGVHIPGTADQRYYENSGKPQKLGHAPSEEGNQGTKEKLPERSRSSDHASEMRGGAIGVGGLTGAAATSSRRNQEPNTNTSILRKDHQHQEMRDSGLKKDHQHDRNYDSKDRTRGDDKDSKSGGFLGIGRRLSNTFKHHDSKDNDTSTRENERHNERHDGKDSVSSSSSVKHVPNEAYVAGQPLQGHNQTAHNQSTHNQSNDQRRTSSGSGSFKGLGKFLRKEKNSPPESPQKGTTFEEQKRLNNTHGTNKGVESSAKGFDSTNKGFAGVNVNDTHDSRKAHVSNKGVDSTTKGFAGVNINDTYDNRKTHDSHQGRDNDNIPQLRQSKLDSDPTVNAPGINTKDNKKPTSTAAGSYGGNQTVPAAHSVENSRVGGQQPNVVEETIIYSSSGYQNDQPTHDLEGRYAMGDYQGNKNSTGNKDAPAHIRNSTMDPENQKEHDKSGLKKLVDKIKH